LGEKTRTTGRHGPGIRYNAHLPKKWNGCGAVAEISALKELRVSQVALTADHKKLQEENDLLSKQASDNEEAIRQLKQLQAVMANLTIESKKLLEENALLRKRACDNDEEKNRLRHLSVGEACCCQASSKGASMSRLPQHEWDGGHLARPRRRLVATEDAADWLRAKMKSHMPVDTAVIRTRGGFKNMCMFVCIL
jgi:hypothetical protein